jgi:DNA-binding transcriptional LysR family regulator
MINISRVDLNLLVIFEAIYTEGGITKAGEALKLSQSAVSHALSRLRQQIDDPLFQRYGNAVSPTPVAQAMIGPVRRALQEIEASFNHLSSFDPLTSDYEFAIGLRPATELILAPKLAKKFGKDAPNTKIISVDYDRSSICHDLNVGRMMVVIDAILPIRGDICQTTLRRGQLVVVARRGHAIFEQPLTPERYLAEHHIVVSSRTTRTAFEDRELARLGYRRRIAMRCQNLWVAAKAVSESDLLLTVPKSYAEAINEALENGTLPLPFDVFPPRAALYWHVTKTEDPANKWLREQIIDVFNRL